MAQARGSQLAVNIYEETTYGQAPGAPAGKKIYVKGFGISSTRSLDQDETLDAARGMPQPTAGNIDVAGALTMNLAAEDMATLLKHALGAVTTYRPVVTQPTNITGVVIARAQSTCPTGNGTLAWTDAANTLTWTANGDTAGAAVDVSAGGSFTLQSGTASRALYVTVTVGSLPVGNQSDTVPVVAAYEHEFTIGSLPTGLTIERDYGSNISGAGRFEQFHGCRVNALKVDVPQSGYIGATLEFKGATSTLASAVLDASVDDPGHTSFHSSAVTTMEEGGAAIVTVTNWDFTLSNDLDDSGYALAQSGRSELPEGMASVSGNLTAMFTSVDLLTKAINGTSSSLYSVMKRGTGSGLAGNEYISVRMPNLVYERKSPEVQGPAGVRQSLAFRGYKSGTELGIKVIVRNLVASP